MSAVERIGVRDSCTKRPLGKGRIVSHYLRQKRKERKGRGLIARKTIAGAKLRNE